MFDIHWADGLDEVQLAAASHGDGPLLIVAGAGTGKTRTLTSRVAAVLERGVPPERLLLLTFTRRAAEEMLSRAAALCGAGGAARRMWGGTFHAVAHRLISEYAAALGLAEITVIDPGDVVDLLEMLRDDHGLTATSGAARAPRAATIADIYTRAVNTGRPAREVITTDFPWSEPHVEQVLEVLKSYVARKRQRGLLDFDDLLLYWRALLNQPAVAERLRLRWDHVLVDEYQDVNQVQVDIVTGLCPDGRGLTVVGDDAQAVYGFRGASSDHLLSLHAALPDATVVKLERNFRSRQPLLELANVVRPGEGAHRVTLHADRPGSGRRPRLVRCHDAGEEARAIADAVLEAVDDGTALREQAVLMRSAHHSDLLEIELTARRVPFVKYGGLKFLEAAHVKDFLATLRVVANPQDEISWFRLLRLHEAVGPARARTLLPLLLAADPDPNDVVAVAPAAARTRLDATLHGIAAAREQPAAAGVVEQCVALLAPLIRRRYPDHAVRLVDIDRLSGAAASSTDLAGFVAEVTLDPAASTSDYAKPPHLDEDFLTLSTVHSAKGLEWPRVHVLHAVDGAFPSDMALSTDEGLAEEHRLFYVAVTRARDELAVYTPLRMPHHRYGRDDRHSYAPASRFLTDEAVATMDVVQLPRPGRALELAATGGPIAAPELDALFE
ncbi:MAG: ATP-dependent helicase UvrD/PcrA [Pseudonocardiales bacterium]|nr:ATP-dependent helicase UvrD/PcrA [Pseudonocardiales bacterium]